MPTIAQTRRLITTKHGLQLVPRWSFNDVPAIERLTVPGSDAGQLASADLKAWEASGRAARIDLIHLNSPGAFPFDAPLLDLARTESVPTAALAAKRLEYRPGTLQTEGPIWPIWLTVRPLLVGLAGVAAAVAIKHRWRLWRVAKRSDAKSVFLAGEHSPVSAAS